MLYCPRCEGIVREPESQVCPACGCVMRSVDELPEEDRDRPVVLTFCQTIFEARILCAALGEQGIVTMVEDESLLDTIHPHWFRDMQPGTRVLVRLEDAEAALELLRRKEAGELAISDDDVPGTDGTEGEPEEDTPAP